MTSFQTIRARAEKRKGGAPTSKRDLAKIQEQFNAWAKETGLPYRHISLICAMSIGENYEGDRYGSDVIAGQE